MKTTSLNPDTASCPGARHSTAAANSASRPIALEQSPRQRCKNPLARLSPLRIGLVALLLAGVALAAAHKKKQADLAPNVVGETTATPNGTLVRFAGIPNFTYAIESSTDGISWTAVTSITAPANGLMNFLDTNSANDSLFYRTAVQ